MADTPISGLPAAAEALTTHEFPATDPALPDADATQKVTGAQVRAMALAGLSSLAIDPDTGAISISGYEVTAGNAATCFEITGEITGAGPDVRVFQITVENPDSRSGDLFRLLAGPNGTDNLMSVSTFGDCEVAGQVRIKALQELDDGGHAAFGYVLADGDDGNIGLFAGLNAPTFSTFGLFGSIYCNGASPGIPYYNTNGTNGWDLLVGGAAAQAITNKTQLHLTPQTAPSSPESGWVIYVDSADGTLKAKNSAGTVRSLAAP